MKSLRDNLALIGFILSTVALAVLYYFFKRRGQKLQDLTYDLLKERLESKMDEARKKALEDGQASDKAVDDYLSLLDRYAPLRKHLGLRDQSHAGRDKTND